MQINKIEMYKDFAKWAKSLDNTNFLKLLNGAVFAFRKSISTREYLKQSPNSEFYVEVEPNNYCPGNCKGMSGYGPKTLSVPEKVWWKMVPNGKYGYVFNIENYKNKNEKLPMGYYYKNEELRAGSWPTKNCTCKFEDPGRYPLDPDSIFQKFVLFQDKNDISKWNEEQIRDEDNLIVHNRINHFLKHNAKGFAHVYTYHPYTRKQYQPREELYNISKHFDTIEFKSISNKTTQKFLFSPLGIKYLKYCSDKLPNCNLMNINIHEKYDESSPNITGTDKNYIVKSNSSILIPLIVIEIIILFVGVWFIYKSCKRKD